MRTAPLAYGLLAAAILPGAAALAQPARPDATERVYYDSLDAQGRLVGGYLDLPIARPAWAVKPRGLDTRGAVNNRVDIVVVGDGYQAGQQALFHANADYAVSTMFSQEPFLTYAPLFAVHQIEVVSLDSGVDNDPTQGISRNTAMDMYYWCSGIQRLICISVSKAYQFAAAAPDVDQILALANSSTYGGAGYTQSELATAAGGNGSAPEIAIHEFGHSLGNLADEYDHGGPQTYTGPELPDPNVSILTAVQMAGAGTKWSNWLGFNNANFDGLISTYQGANYSAFGVYRPTNNSKMRSLGRPFNLPSAESIIIQVYHIVRPIDDATDSSAELSGFETVFVDPVDPVGDPLAVQWSLDNVELPGSTATTLDLAAIALAPGPHLLSVKVVDNTWIVRDQAARETWMTEFREWKLLVPDIPGDVNCDRLLTADDAVALTQALLDQDAYAAANPNCPIYKADVNADSLLDGNDVQAEVYYLMP